MYKRQVINALIDKILVSEREKMADGTVKQEIKIYYKFIEMCIRDSAYLIPEGIEDYSYTKDGKEIKGSQYKVKMEFPKKKK